MYQATEWLDSSQGVWQNRGYVVEVGVPASALSFAIPEMPWPRYYQTHGLLEDVQLRRQSHAVVEMWAPLSVWSCPVQVGSKGWIRHYKHKLIWRLEERRLGGKPVCPALPWWVQERDLDSFVVVVFGKCVVKHAQLTTKLYRGMGSKLAFHSRHWTVTLNCPCGFGAVFPLFPLFLARLGEVCALSQVTQQFCATPEWKISLMPEHVFTYFSWLRPELQNKEKLGWQEILHTG